MTITSEVSKTGPYTGNASTTVFAYSFKVNDQAHLVVTLKTISTGAEVIKSISTHYSVSGVGDEGGGNVTMSVAPAVGETLTISRSVTKSQTTDLVNRGSVQPEVLESALDRNVQMNQDLTEIVERSLKFPVSDASLTDTLPASSVRAGKYLTFDDSGNVSTTAGASAEATAAAASAVAAAASAVTAANEASAAAPKYTFSTTTSMADPGAGILRYNHGTVASVTAIAIDDTTADTGNPDIAAWITSWDDSTSTIKGQIRLVEPGTPANYAVFNVTALTDNSGWVQLAVTHVDSNGTFGNTDSIRVTFSRVGDKGDTGSTGTTGSGEGLELNFEDTTTDTDQGAGKVWYNNGTVSSASVFYIDDVDANAVNINSFVDSWDDSGSTIKGRLTVKKQLAPENYHMFNVTGAVTSASTYSKIAVTHVVSTGTISDGDAIFVSFSRTGDKGSQGVQGDAGSDGEVSEATAVALAIALG